MIEIIFKTFVGLLVFILTAIALARFLGAVVLFLTAILFIGAFLTIFNSLFK